MATETQTISQTNGDDGKHLFEKFSAQKVEPLWTVMHSMVKPKPSPRSQVCLWQYKDLRPLLVQAGNYVSSEDAERRVLMLVNPALKAPFTTDTIYAGLQLINPGETAPAHRHQAFALRFIIEGNRGYTAVDGERIFMEVGDLILTPQWQWHDHGHEGEGPMIWLDGLDLPLYHQLPTHFAEPYSEPRYPSVDALKSPLRFPWIDMKAKLDGLEGSFAIETYRDPSGSFISATLGAMAARVSAGSTSPSSRDTSSYVFHVISGRGKSMLELSDGTSKIVTWTRSDTFAVPAWTSVVHVADGGEDAYLFVMTDKPVLEALHMYVADGQKSR